jgi:hypothetical protein
MAPTVTISSGRMGANWFINVLPQAHDVRLAAAACPW